jgi:hypothetical protein
VCHLAAAKSLAWLAEEYLQTSMTATATITTTNNTNHNNNVTKKLNGNKFKNYKWNKTLILVSYTNCCRTEPYLLELFESKRSQEHCI